MREHALREVAADEVLALVPLLREGAVDVLHLAALQHDEPRELVAVETAHGGLARLALRSGDGALGFDVVLPQGVEQVGVVQQE